MKDQFLIKCKFHLLSSCHLVKVRFRMAVVMNSVVTNSVRQTRPEVLNVDNPLQARGAARGMES